jgi:aspartate ammonia-lyase
MRIETDFLGELTIADEALYGIHSLRAKDNFPDTTAFHTEWYKAMGLVKQACYLCYRNFKKAALQHNPDSSASANYIADSTVNDLIASAVEVSQGRHYEHFIVPAIQGGAGTSINLNVNEIIANRALRLQGHQPGNYQLIDPIEHANIFQSTNDVVPTALRVAAMQLLRTLEDSINTLRASAEELETQHRHSLRIGYTQMQEAVPTSYGRLFATYSEALSHDWWRVSKCSERIKVVNLGGGAIGTGLAIPRFFIMEVVQELQQLTHLPVTRGENLQDATCNLDTLVEVHAILKAHAVNLEKMVSDLRLLASDLVGWREIEIPNKQVGSSIMPGKINPVIPEFVVSAAHRVYANDSLITSLCAQGCLELNAYLPAIGHALLESLKLLVAAGQTLQKNLFAGLTVHPATALQRLYRSPALTTALNPHIGYHKAAEMAREMKDYNLDIFAANQKLNLVSTEKLQKILEPNNLLKMGYSVKDLE